MRPYPGIALLGVALVMPGGGCEAPAVRGAPTTVDSQAEERKPVHIDSILPIDEEVRRFRERVGRRADALEGGTDGRDALVASFVTAVERADTAALARMAIDAAEFIDLYYPHTMYTSRPYELSPSIVWLLVGQNGEKGLVRILRRLAGKPFGFEGYRCDPAPKIEGRNRLWDGCVLDRTANGQRESLRLFGSIIERDGRFKFVSYANDL
jgi:hypothetical protein